MSLHFGTLLLLGFVAGATILLGLPVGRLHAKWLTQNAHTGASVSGTVERTAEIEPVAS